MCKCEFKLHLNLIKKIELHFYLSFSSVSLIEIILEEVHELEYTYLVTYFLKYLIVYCMVL